MCGIAGIYLFKNHSEQLDQIEVMTQALSHRGPDDEGYFINDKVALGHRRLSIIDLSSNAKQPMFNEDSSLVLVFNGEIYNFRELKKLLIAKGHRFKSACDSEVVLHLYEDYGVECARYLEGMFAFAIYDIRQKTLYFARDRVGEKPLYYFKNKEGFYFSSEIKSFFGLDNFEKKISEVGLYAYFNYIQIPSPHTIFDSVKKLHPAHWLFVNSDGDEILKPYWHVDCSKKTKVPIAEAKNQLKELMLDSVEKTLISDVPVGVMLSGGVDSSLILALAKEVGGSFKTFTVGSDSYGTDDEYIRTQKVISKFNVKNYAYNFGSVDFSELIEAVRFCDEPVGLLEIFYIFGVNQKIKEHVKVILTGNGADEIFGGYVGYGQTRRLADFFGVFKGAIYRSNHLLNSGAAAYHIFHNWKVLNKLFSDNIKKFRSDDSSSALLPNAMRLVSYDNILDAKLFMDLLILCNHSVSSIPDTAGMSNSIELRSPFLNHKIIEFVATLPLHYKVLEPKNPLYNKYLLKELACDYFDKEDVYVPKYGFGYFINSFSLIRGKWKKEVENIIFDPLVQEGGFFEERYVKNIWTKFLKDKLRFREQLIFSRFLMFCIWYKYKFLSS